MNGPADEGDTGFTDLAGERVVLRRFSPADLTAFVAYRSDPAVARYQSWEAPYPESDGQHLIEAMLAEHQDAPGAWYQYAVALKSTGEFGYTIAPRHQGGG